MEERTTQPLGSLSHRMREARGRLSPERAAAALGLSSNALREIEDGQRDASVGQLLNAAGFYGVELRSLLFGRPAADPALAHLGPELAELLQEYLRDRHGAERVDQLDDAQLAELNRVVGQVRRFGGLVEGLLRRDKGAQGGGRPGDALEALAAALERIERLLAREPAPRDGSVPSAAQAEALRGYRFEARPDEAMRPRHAAFRQGLDWFARSGGRVADDELGFQRLLPWLQIVVPAGDGFPYLYCGERTPPAELWGEAVARALVGSFRLPDLRLDRATAEAFPEVRRSGVPLIQAVHGPVVVGGVTRLDSWHRVLLPLEFRGLACIASLAVRDLSLDGPAPLAGEA